MSNFRGLLLTLWQTPPINLRIPPHLPNIEFSPHKTRGRLIGHSIRYSIRERSKCIKKESTLCHIGREILWNNYIKRCFCKKFEITQITDSFNLCSPCCYLISSNLARLQTFSLTVEIFDSSSRLLIVYIILWSIIMNYGSQIMIKNPTHWALLNFYFDTSGTGGIDTDTFLLIWHHQGIF